MVIALKFILGIGLCLVGLAGLLLPAIPGAPLLFLGLVVIAWAENFAYVDGSAIAVLGLLAALTLVVDVAAGVLGAKGFGASKRALWGAGLGALIGLFFGIAGVLLGPLVGACLAEFTLAQDVRGAGRAGLGASLGLLLGVAVKIALAFSMLGVFAVTRLQ